MKKLTKEILETKHMLWIYDKGMIADVYQFKGVKDLVDVMRDYGAYNEYDADDWKRMDTLFDVKSLKDIAKVILAEKFFDDDESERLFSIQLPCLGGGFIGS